MVYGKTEQDASRSISSFIRSIFLFKTELACDLGFIYSVQTPVCLALSLDLERQVPVHLNQH